MLASLYTTIALVGAIVGAAAMLHYVVVSWRNAKRKGEELARALEAREQGGPIEPLPCTTAFYRGTLPTALFAAFAVDGAVSTITGTFETRAVVERAAMATFVAGGVQYVVTALRRDRRSGVWPNSPWLAWAVAAALGLLGGLAEASDPGVLP